MNGPYRFLVSLDWLVFAGGLTLVLFLPALARRLFREMRREQYGTTRTRSWFAAGLTLVANEWGGAALVIIPALVTALRGNLTLIQWAAGVWLARGILAIAFVGPIRREAEGDPFVFLERRLGRGARWLAEGLSLVASLIVQSVSVLALAMVLSLLSPLSPSVCVILAGSAAVLWGLAGRPESVGRDLFLFSLTILLAAGSLLFLLSGWGEGWAGFLRSAGSFETFDGEILRKLQWLDLQRDPRMEFTLQVALLAIPFQQMQAIGLGSLTQRTLARCRGAREARLALLVSAFSPAFVLLLLFLGCALFTFYARNPPTDPVVLRTLEWNGGGPGAPERVFPVWILTEIPAGWRGALLALLAASTFLGLDTTFAACSQIFRRRRGGMSLADTAETRHPFPVLAGGLLLTGFALVPVARPEHAPSAPTFEHLIFAISWCCGPLLGILIVALLGKARLSGLIASTLLSPAILLYLNPECWTPYLNPASSLRMASWPGYAVGEDSILHLRPEIATEWLWPLTTLLAVAVGWKWQMRMPWKSKMFKNPK